MTEPVLWWFCASCGEEVAGLGDAPPCPRCGAEHEEATGQATTITGVSNSPRQRRSPAHLYREDVEDWT